MKLPFYRPNHRSLTFTLVLLMIFVVLLLTGLGVFRLYFAFDWTAGDDTGQLFALKIRGGQALNIFEAAPFGRVFWITQLALLLLCILLPLFRISGALLIAIATAIAVTLLHKHEVASVAGKLHGTPVGTPVGTPLEFELLIIAVVTIVYVLLSYIGDQRDQQRIARLLSKFVPEELSRQYQRDPDALSVAGEEREISVLFCDVRDFTVVAQTLDSAKLATWLNLYFTHVSKIVVRYRGSIDKYMGDSVMAVWGAPARSVTHAYDALCAALDIQKELGELNEKYRNSGLPEISMGIGISTGPAMVGPLGSEHRMDYTVIGDTVNVAQRLEEQTRKYQVPVIVGDKTIEDLPDMLFRELDTVTVKGRTKMVTMYQPLCAITDATEALLELASMHEKAMAATVAGQWDEAVTLFSELSESWGPKDMYERYLRGIEQAR
ncbi:MAG: adenylate/guanylate cyclase domain-containing protein [Granulosicoccus sp.]